MTNKEAADNYVPYGPEWEKELMKLSKPLLIEMVKKANLKRKELEQSATQGAGRWVRASERLPEISEKLLWRFEDASFANTGYNQNGFKFAYDLRLSKEDDIKTIEWLDESTPSINTEQDFINDSWDNTQKELQKRLLEMTDRYAKADAVLRELVELKDMKDADIRHQWSEDYLKRKPLAWLTARKLIENH